MSLQPAYVSKEKLELKAEKLLASYRGGSHLDSPEPLDIESFAEFHLEATLDYHRLSEDGSILGMSIFQDLSTPVLDGRGRAIDVMFPAQTIVIDHDALSGSPESRMRFTVAHECAHLILHQHIYYRDPTMKCSSNNSYRPFTIATEEVASEGFDRAEFQANYLGAALLMPRTPFKQAFGECVPGRWYDLPDWQKKRAIRELADTFETSLQATAVRVKNLELVE